MNKKNELKKKTRTIESFLIQEIHLCIDFNMRRILIREISKTFCHASFVVLSINFTETNGNFHNGEYNDDREFICALQMCERKKKTPPRFDTILTFMYLYVYESVCGCEYVCGACVFVR